VELRRFYSLSLDAYSGTRRRLATTGPGRSRFYSLSLDAYSGTGISSSPTRCRSLPFLFAVARRVQRNNDGHLERGKHHDARFYSLSLDAYSGTPASRATTQSGMFLFAVARRVQRNGVMWLNDVFRFDNGSTFLFAVARRVQRNRPVGPTA